MRRMRVLMMAAALVCAVSVARADDEKPDATLKLSGGSFALGIGVSWGSGTLTYQGKDYPISVTGLTLGSIGATSLEAEGRVYHLSKLEDFDGNYAAVAADVTGGKGASVLTMKNPKGVKVNMGATTKGVKLTLGAGGVDMKIKQ